MVTEVSAVVPLNAYLPILVTPSGMVIEVSEFAYWNACSPMLVTASGPNVSSITEDGISRAPEQFDLHPVMVAVVLPALTS
jgi:hypothetical protein